MNIVSVHASQWVMLNFTNYTATGLTNPDYGNDYIYTTGAAVSSSGFFRKNVTIDIPIYGLKLQQLKGTSASQTWSNISLPPESFRFGLFAYRTNYTTNVLSSYWNATNQRWITFATDTLTSGMIFNDSMIFVDVEKPIRIQDEVFCYQESPTIRDQSFKDSYCNQNYTGSFSYSGNVTNPLFADDGINTTYAGCSTAPCTFIFNWTKPYNDVMINSTFSVYSMGMSLANRNYSLNACNIDSPTWKYTVTNLC